MKNIELNGTKFKLYTEEEFINLETFDEKRYVGIHSENNQIQSIVIIEQQYIKKHNLNYLELHNQCKFFNFYIQKQKNDFPISVEDNLELIQKHFDQLKFKQNTPLLDTNKAKKSYKHL